MAANGTQNGIRRVTLGWAVGLVAHGASAGEPMDVPAFTNQTDASGLTFTHFSESQTVYEMNEMTPGAAAADFNRDGWIDLAVNGGAGQNLKLFINNGDGTFEEQALAWGIDRVDSDGSSLTVGDVDANGYPDLYVGTLFERNYLYLNNGNGTFTEHALDAGVALDLPDDVFLPQRTTYGGAFGDFDLDGDLDLYTTQWWADSTNGTRLFANNGDSTFEDVTKSSQVLITDTFWAFSPRMVDLNGDRYPELIVAADFGTSRYFANNTDGTFSFLRDNGTGTDENGMGAAVGDYDNDGDLDWFVTSILDDDGEAEGNWGVTGNRLYRNDGEHQFTDVTDNAGVRHAGWGWGTSFADLNADGWLDLVATNGWEAVSLPNGDEDAFEDDPTRLWLNTGGENPAFVDVAEDAGLDHTGQGRGLVVFDYDRDGDLDVVITTNFGDLALYRNELNPSSQRWLEVDLVAPPGNAPDGIGAVVRVTIDDATHMRVVDAGSTFMSTEPSRVHFGFPATDAIDVLEIVWPDGTYLHMIDIEPGQFVKAVRGNLNGDGQVNVSDLLRLLEMWGRCAGEPCPADLNGDATVDDTDLLILLSNWD